MKLSELRELLMELDDAGLGEAVVLTPCEGNYRLIRRVEVRAEHVLREDYKVGSVPVTRYSEAPDKDADAVLEKALVIG